MIKKYLRKFIIVALCIIVIGMATTFGINEYVKYIGAKKIIAVQEASQLNDVDCIVVLGCQVHNDGSPSGMLNDRLVKGIELYKNGVAPKIIMSGDHGRIAYDEVNTMKQFAIDAGVPSEDIFMDHAGFSTYESIYRARDIFEADKIIVVTQKYHLYRSIYIANMLGVEAYGVNTDFRIYGGEKYREAREILARCKDFAKSIYKPEPTYLGDVIPVSGDGNLTND